jgi:hypothetical protein
VSPVDEENLGPEGFGSSSDREIEFIVELFYYQQSSLERLVCGDEKTWCCLAESGSGR